MCDEQVHISIIVIVAEERASTHRWTLKISTGTFGNFLESIVSTIPKELIGLAIGQNIVCLLNIVNDMSVSDEDVPPAIVVHIKETCAESDK